MGQEIVESVWKWVVLVPALFLSLLPTLTISITSSDGHGHSHSHGIGHGHPVLSFHPISYDFKESPMGIPRLGVIRVENRLTDENLKLISISGSTVHFHSSFFADKIISPGSNTTFEVVFLGRAEGLVESSLCIHTSKGLFKYHVQGYGLPNPYRLKPLVGARIPVNGSYEPLITMHNPHSRRIQVVEMFSSDSDFHLSLPDDVRDEEEASAWAIEPFQTKPLMKGTFQGKLEGNHTGYIKIRVNSTVETNSSEYLLLPVEVTVSSKPGLYSPQDSLDFGLLVPTDKPKTLSLSLINAQENSVHVQSVTVKGDPNPGIRIEFRPLSLDPDTGSSTVIALITFDPSEVQDTKDCHGYIEIRSDNGESITVPFSARLLRGDLEYKPSSLGFYTKSETLAPKNFTLKNTFPSSVVIYDVKVSHPLVVSVKPFNESVVLLPGDEKAICHIQVEKKSELCDSKHELYLSLKSNITNLNLPISCYDGRLKMLSTDGKAIKFGRVEIHSKHIEYFSIDNTNPVEIRLKSWGSNTSWAHVDLVGMQKGRKEDLTKINDFDALKKFLFLQPGHMAVFSVELRNPNVEGTYWGETFLTTDHNQTLRLPFSFTVSKGSIHSDTIKFDKAFPGKISLEKLSITTTLNSTLSVRKVNTSPESAPIWFTSSSTVPDQPVLAPHRKTCIGKLHFDPKEFCGDKCYSGFLLESPLGIDWVRASSVDWQTGDLDWRILKTLQKRYEEVKDLTVSNVSLWLDTMEATPETKLTTQIQYIWPRITSQKSFLFPLTGLGNESFYDIPISNPSNSPLFVQALLSPNYGSSWQTFATGNGIGGNLTQGQLAFSLHGLGSSSSQSQENTILFSHVHKQIYFDNLLPLIRKIRRMDLEAMKNLAAEEDLPGISFILPPGAKFFLRTKFQPSSKDLTATVLLFRNNLTGIETVWLKGRGGVGQLTLGNGPPGSSLLFQITEKLLQGCQRESTSKYVPPQLTVRRSFIARNIGEIPLQILGMEISPSTTYFSYIWPLSSLGYPSSASISNDYYCEGYGFRILNCSPFIVGPNETHSIDIAFTPDFTLSRVSQSLRLIDAMGNTFNYSLIAMIPPGMLTVCSSILARPSWESVLKYFLIFGVILAIIGAGFMSYFEANSIVSSAVVATVRVVPADSRDLQEATSKLDLRSVYDKVDNRFKRNAQQMTSQQQSTKFPPPPPPLPLPQQVATNCIRNRKKSTPNNPALTNPPIKNTCTYKSKASPTNEHCTSTNGLGEDELLASERRNKRKSTGKGNQSSSGSGVKKGRPTRTTQHPVVVASSHVEEETSSTTTEGSTTDDLLSSIEKNKENHNVLDEHFTVNNDFQQHLANNKSNKKNKRPSTENNENSAPRSLENITSTNVTVSANPEKGFIDVKKKSGSICKKKQLSGSSTSSGNGGGSPNPEISTWEPCKSSGVMDGFIDNFSLPKPQASTKRINNNNTYSNFNSLKNSNNSLSSGTLQFGNEYQNQMNSYSPPGFSYNTSPSYTVPSFSRSSLQSNTPPMQQPQRRPPAGVIGQPRQAQQNSFINGVMTTLSLALGTNTSTNTMNSTRGNGPWTSTSTSEQDVWNGRRNSSGSNFVNGTDYTRGNKLSPPATSNSSFLFNSTSGINSEVLSGLWQLNSGGTPDPHTATIQTLLDSGYNGSSNGGFNQLGYSKNHGQVSRMRSEPPTSSVRNQPGFPSQNNWNSPFFTEPGPPSPTSSSILPQQDFSNPTLREPVWPLSPSTLVGSGNDSSLCSPGSTWGQRSPPPGLTSTSNPWDAELSGNGWTTGPLTTSRTVGTPSVIQRPTETNNLPSQLCIGTEISRPRNQNDIVKNQREIEAGLGFNPFVTDIWNQNHHTPEGSSGWSQVPSSTTSNEKPSSFRYDSLN